MVNSISVCVAVIEAGELLGTGVPFMNPSIPPIEAVGIRLGLGLVLYVELKLASVITKSLND